MNMAEAIGEFLQRTSMEVIILTFALMMTRILPVIILSPFLGGETVPTEVKIGLGVVLGIVLFPAVAPSAALIEVNAVRFVLLMSKELFIGLAMAFVVNLVFEAAKMAGTLMDTLGGTAMAQLHVPQIQQTVSLFASLKLQFAVVLFLTLHGHHVVIEALGESFLRLPVADFPRFSGGMWSFFEHVIRVAAHMFTVGLALAAPVLVATFLTDLSFGMINKVAPQIQVFFLSMSIKPLVAVVMTLVALDLLGTRLIREFRGMFSMLYDALRLLA